MSDILLILLETRYSLLRDHLVHLVHKENEVLVVKPVLQDNLVIKEKKVTKETQETKVIREHKVPKELMA